MSRLISPTEAAQRIDKCLLVARQGGRLDVLRQDLIQEIFIVHRKGFDAGLMERARSSPKRFYSQREIAEFRADGTNWPQMFRAALSNIERGNFNVKVIEDVRRMGELSGLSNKQIGSEIAKAKARILL